MGFKKRPTITRRARTEPAPPPQVVNSTTSEPDEDKVDEDSAEWDEGRVPDDAGDEYPDDDAFLDDEDEDDHEDGDEANDDVADENEDEDDGDEDEDDGDGDEDEDEFSSWKKSSEEEKFLDSIEDFEDEDEDDEDEDDEDEDDEDEDDDHGRLITARSVRPDRKQARAPEPDDYGVYRGQEADEEEDYGVWEDGPGSVDEYMETLDDEPRAIVARLRELIREIAPEARESVKWGMPHYANRGHLLYLDAKRDHVNLGFFRGDELADLDAAKGQFEGAGGKLRHIKIFSAEGIPKAALQELIPAAEKLNQESSEL